MTPSPRLSVLLVDDDVALRIGVGFMLRNLGHRVHMASSGSEAIHVLRGGLGVDLVLLDICMPDMDGYETITHLRALHPHLPILVVSGTNPGRVQEDLSTASGIPFLPKPFTQAQLHDAITSMAIPPGP